MGLLKDIITVGTHAAWEAGKATAGMIGSAAWNTAGKAGTVLAKGAAGTALDIAEWGLTEGPGAVKTTAKMAARAADHTISRLHDIAMAMPDTAKYRHGRDIYDTATGKLKHEGGGLKFTRFGLGALFGGSMLANIPSSTDSYRAGRMGTIDPAARTATPHVEPREYTTGVPNGGATGDLVFALNAGRHKMLGG